MANFCRYHNIYNYEDVNKIAEQYLKEHIEQILDQEIYEFKLHGIEALLERTTVDNEIIEQRLIDEKRETN